LFAVVLLLIAHRYKEK